MSRYGAPAAVRRYYISARPRLDLWRASATLTGSIGILPSFRPSTDLGKCGVSVDRRSQTPLGELSIDRPWATEARARLPSQISRAIDEFLARVPRAATRPTSGRFHQPKGRVCGAGSHRLGRFYQLGSSATRSGLSAPPKLTDLCTRVPRARAHPCHSLLALSTESPLRTALFSAPARRARAARSRAALRSADARK